MTENEVVLSARRIATAQELCEDLERRAYIATTKHIEALALTYVDSRLKVMTAGSTYLRILVAECQAAVVAAGESAAKGAASTSDGSGKDAGTSAVDLLRTQRHALGLIHRKYYPIILSTVTTPDVAKAPRMSPEEKRRRAKERNRRSNFARSSYSLLRSWSRAGHDIMQLRVERVSKRLLAEGIPAQERANSKVAALQGRRAIKAIDRQGAQLRALAERAVKVDGPAAAAAIEKLARQLFRVIERHQAIDAVSTKEEAVSQGKPWRTGGSVFLPLGVPSQT